MAISKLNFELNLTDVKCNVKSCENQAIFIEELRNLESPLAKKIDLEGFIILCKEHRKSIFPKIKQLTTISFVDQKGNFVCTRCTGHWKNPMPNHQVPKTCRLCTNIRWNKPYVKERVVVGVKKHK